MKDIYYHGHVYTGCGSFCQAFLVEDGLIAVAGTDEEALDSFTIRGARASFEEDRKGRIAPGCYADFTILGQNPFETEPNQLHQIPVTACYLGGRRTFGAPFETERN